MNKFIYIFTLAFVILLFSCSEETHMLPIGDKIITNKKGIESKINFKSRINSGQGRYITFWDFDGTIIKGDCTEGYRENDKVIYKGLAQLVIESGLSKKYPHGQYSRFLSDYNRITKLKGHREAYIFVTRLCSGIKRSKILALSRDHFRNVLQYYYFKSSIDIIRKLQKEGIDIYVISASPEFFVKGAADTLGIPEERIFGITLNTIADKIGTLVRGPVLFAEGKTEKILEIINRIEISEKKGQTEFSGTVHVLGGFGNSYSTDGHFLHWIDGLRGPTVAVIINGGSPPQGMEGLVRITQKHTMKNVSPQ